MDPVVAALIGLVLGALVGIWVGGRMNKRNEEEQEEDEGLTRSDSQALLDALRAGVALVGPHDEILASNATAEQFGLIKGSRIVIPAVLDLVRTTRDTSDVEHVNVTHRSTARTSYSLAVRVVPLPKGRLFVVADDRGETLRAQESSRDFISNVTHELKTPIGAISLLSEAIGDASDDPVAVERFAGKIQSESVRLADLVQQIITLSRLQGYPALVRGEPVLVEGVVSEAINHLRPLAEGRKITLTAAPTPGLWVKGDFAQLVTALENLVQNAINYSEPGARVAVTTRRRSLNGADWVDIAVTDNGIGISADEQQRIFERFYRVDFARSRETGGTGLGLSIVSEIAEGHGGSVSVWSQPGHGSTFTLRLPETDDGDDEEENA